MSNHNTSQAQVFTFTKVYVTIWLLVLGSSLTLQNGKHFTASVGARERLEAIAQLICEKEGWKSCDFALSRRELSADSRPKRGVGLFHPDVKLKHLPSAGATFSKVYVTIWALVLGSSLILLTP